MGSWFGGGGGRGEDLSTGRALTLIPGGLIDPLLLGEELGGTTPQEEYSFEGRELWSCRKKKNPNNEKS